MREINQSLSTLLVALIFGLALFPRLPKWLLLGVTVPALIAACFLLFWKIPVPISRDQYFLFGFGSNILLLAVAIVFLVRKPWATNPDAGAPKSDKPKA